MFGRIAEVFGKAIAVLVLAIGAWYAFEPLRNASPELQKGLLSGLVIGAVIGRLLRF
jgi:hypothetical protein